MGTRQPEKPFRVLPSFHPVASSLPNAARQTIVNQKSKIVNQKALSGVFNHLLAKAVKTPDN
jgi:hypothetical protein